MSSPRITRALLSESIREKDDYTLVNLLPSVTSDQINTGMEEDGNTPLHNNVNDAEELIKIEGVDLNATNNDGETPIMVVVSWLHQELLQIFLADIRVNIDVRGKDGNDLDDHIGKCVEGEEDAKEVVKTMVAEERKRRVETMQSKQEEMMQLTQQEREIEVGAQKRGIKEMGVREYAKAKKEHAKSKIDEKKESAKSKMDLKKVFAKSKLDQLKQKIGAKTAREST